MRRKTELVVGQLSPTLAQTLRLLHVIGSLDQRHGGPLRAVLDLSSSARAVGLHSEVLSVGMIHIPDNPLEREFIHAIPVPNSFAYGYTPKIRSWLRNNISRFDFVVLHGMWTFPGWAAARACWRAGVPYAVFPHGMLEPWSVFDQGVLKLLKKILYWQLVERHLFQKAKCCFFTTQKELQEARKVFRSRAPAHVVAPYGVSPTARRDTNPESIPEIQGRKYILFLGRLHPCKNVPLLLRAWKRAQMPDEWRIIIAGPSEEDYRRQLEETADALGIRDQCVFFDFVSGSIKSSLLSHAEWFVLPSDHENFGVAVFEAIMHGCPVSISDKVYSAEYFEDLGRVLPVDEATWADFLKRTASDPEYRKIVISADKKVIQNFSMDAVAFKWATLITQLVEQS